MSAAPAPRLYTPEEYLALEREAEFKSEYIDGYIVPVQGPLAMAGTSKEHNVIAGNLFSELRAQMKGAFARHTSLTSGSAWTRADDSFTQT